MKIILGTANPGKIKEIESILSPLGFEIVVADPLDVEETGETVEENAKIKAIEYSKANPGVLVLADDSGLVVPGLNNLPGPYSARLYSLEFKNIYGKPVIVNIPEEDHTISKEEQDQRNIDKLLELAKNLECKEGQELLKGDERLAYYETCIALALNGDVLKIFKGRSNGRIETERRGTNGFGYDSIFISVGNPSKTFAELDPEIKNKISHRGMALYKLKEWLE